VLSTSPFNHPQCPFIQMTNTDVTFLPHCNNMDLARLYVMILTSPPSLSPSRLWAGLGVRWPSQSHPVTQGLPVLESLPFNSLSVPGYKKLTSDITLLTTTASVPPAPHPPFKGLPLPKSFPPILLKSGRRSCCLTSLRLVPVLPDPNLPSCSKVQCRPPRQNANVNLLAKMPMSTPSPKCTAHEPLTPSLSRCPREGLTEKCPTLGILRLMYLLGFDSHSALPISARNTSIEPNLAHSATHRPNLS
jgi:hypothetical protein